ncbi:hypothetical protein AbHV_ORF4 [Abalone herpesvirus Victoria/AUS/2009]|uniref:Uncharacterized protein n=1 Tax=Abalone herpesvirus (isolate Abalone/Australia/Victoria/2009) TaxID=1241371 RepID=K4JUD1_ABHV|nr:hypothetical protein AbHV_ORF4 [Abalone herpesvirus Victoria/AUS/2009]AFU90014.1 hypothetical protein AbHV_ORF4 [Abalone herpesvirus Victoria/AUS/2009]
MASTSSSNVNLKRSLESEGGERGGVKKMKVARMDCRPGKVMRFTCKPVEKRDQAVRELSEKLGSAARIIAGNDDGVVVVKFEERFQKARDFLDGFDWMLEDEAELNRWFEIDSNEKLYDDDVMKLSDDIEPIKIDEDVHRLLNYLYSVKGMQTEFKGKSKTYFLFTLNNLIKLKLIESKGENAERTLKRIGDIDPNNFKLYKYGELFGLRHLPNMPHTFIFNRLDYKPMGEIAVAVRSGHICKALSNFKTETARKLGDVMAMVFEKVITKVAEDHVKEVGMETFVETVVRPTLEGALPEAIDSRLELLDAESKIMELKAETVHERMLRLKAEAEAVKFDGLRIQAEEASRESKLLAIESQINEIKAQEETRVALFDKRQAELGEERIRLEKEKEANKFKLERIIERPNQDLTHQGDRRRREGVVWIQRTHLSSAEEKRKKPVYKQNGEVSTEPLHYTLYRSEHEEKSETLRQTRDLVKKYVKKSSYTMERLTPSLVLYGGNNVEETKKLFKQTFKARGGRLLMTVAEEAEFDQKIREKIVPFVKQSYALGLHNGTLAFCNEAILKSLPVEDEAFCMEIIGEM